MRPISGLGSVCALVLLGTAADSARAAWCNVFQVCCHSCGSAPAVSAYTPDPCCNPCPPVCTTRYVQRCYYQPVTCYQTRKYCEPVTTYRTSYYWEPVTSYRYSCYYDPCTCRYQQVACPQTCYRLRSQCCPVQSWVERCCQVPVTTYRQCSYWEPVTTCCQPACPSPCGYPGAATPGVTDTGAAGQPVTPGVSEPGSNQQLPGVKEYRGSYSPLYDRTSPTPQPPISGNGTYRQLRPSISAPAKPASPEPPAVHPERVTSASMARVEGIVVRRDNVPEPGARVLFVSMTRKGPQETVTADTDGQFRARLASGGWLVYLHGQDGKPVFHSKLEVRDNETRQMTLQNR
jgi:hypothetical protein